MRIHDKHVMPAMGTRRSHQEQAPEVLSLSCMCKILEVLCVFGPNYIPKFRHYIIIKKAMSSARLELKKRMSLTRVIHGLKLALGAGVFAPQRATQVRWQLSCREELPPTQPALRRHVRRATFVACTEIPYGRARVHTCRNFGIPCARGMDT